MLAEGQVLGSTSVSVVFSMQKEDEDSQHHYVFSAQGQLYSSQRQDEVCVGDRMLNVEMHALCTKKGVKPQENRGSKRRA